MGDSRTHDTATATQFNTVHHSAALCNTIKYATAHCKPLHTAAASRRCTRQRRHVTHNKDIWLIHVWVRCLCYLWRDSDMCLSLRYICFILCYMWYDSFMTCHTNTAAGSSTLSSMQARTERTARTRISSSTVPTTTKPTAAINTTMTTAPSRLVTWQIPTTRVSHVTYTLSLQP